MKRNNKKHKKRGGNSLSKLSLFQKNDNKLSRNVSINQNAPTIDYKNISLLKKYVTENGKYLI